MMSRGKTGFSPVGIEIKGDARPGETYNVDVSGFNGVHERMDERERFESSKTALTRFSRVAGDENTSEHKEPYAQKPVARTYNVNETVRVTATRRRTPVKSWWRAEKGPATVTAKNTGW